MTNNKEKDYTLGYVQGYNQGTINGVKIGMNNSGGGDSDDGWQPPSDWITVPEPADNEVYALVDTKATSVFACRASSVTGTIIYTVDWGDGTIETYSGNETNYTFPEHTYTETNKQYLIKFSTNDTENCKGFYLRVESQYTIHGELIVKYGTSIPAENFAFNLFNGYGSLHEISLSMPERGQSSYVNQLFQGCGNLRKITLNGITQIPDSCFLSCANLQKISLSDCTKINSGGFSMCTTLQSISAPLCTSLGTYAFSGCTSLQTFSAPLCTTVGDGAFLNCLSLETVVFSDSCTFGNNCFNNTHMLFPKPNES